MILPQRATPYAARVRAAVVRARRQGHAPRPPAPMTPPTAAMRAYAARLTTMVQAAVVEAYKPLLADLPALVAQAREERGDAAGWRADASRSGRSASAAVASASAASSRSLSVKRVAASASAAADDAGAHVQAELGRQVKDVLGIDLMPDAKARARVAAFVHENVKLITGIAPTLAAEVESLLLAGLSGGQLHEMLALAIKSKLKIAINRAELIAVDQLGKLTGQIAAARAQDLGATHFYWRTAEDERVRGNPAGKYPRALPSHYARNGQRYAYADPPKGKNGESELPGVPIRCRCYGEPDLTTVPGFEGVAEEAAAITGSPEDLEAEAERLRLEVEAMLAGPPSPSMSDLARALAAARAAPRDPTPPASPTPATEEVRLREVRSAAEAGMPSPPRSREAEVMRDGVAVAYASKRGGVTDSYLVAYEHGGQRMRAIVKPEVGSEPTPRYPAPVSREVIASDLASHLGVGGMVPTTVRRDGPPLGTASSQAFAEGAIQTARLTAEQVARIDRAAMVRMRVFDFIIGNNDRHDENVLWIDDGTAVTPVLIDHGYTMPTSSSGMFQPTIGDFDPDEISMPEVSQPIIDAVDVEVVAVTMANGGLDLRSIQGTLHRIAVAKLMPSLLDKPEGKTAAKAAMSRSAAASGARELLTKEQADELDAVAYRAFRDATRKKMGR